MIESHESNRLDVQGVTAERGAVSSDFHEFLRYFASATVDWLPNVLQSVSIVELSPHGRGEVMVLRQL